MVDLILISLITILLGFILILLIYFFQSGGINAIKSSNKSPYFKPSFLILGANNSGKTLYFYNLQQNDININQTISSIDPNFKEFILPFSNPAIGKKFQFVDYPGHLKYQNLFKNLLINDITLNNIKGIIYMIDSSNSNWSDPINVENIVKYLYNLLSITERKPNGVDFLFAINKSDLFDSLPPHKIKKILEKELGKLIKNEITNVNKNSDLDKKSDFINNDDEDVNNNDTLREFWLGIIGSSDAEFTFDKLEGNMDFISGSVLKNKISQWENWLDERVVNSS
ncbi:unnamed protein product [Candida verbasci]|uniref:Signal recognition particle receptor subunit beta n=1 Tax=Candida verbasci TaxID=1227364 RepID=A0A9W4TRL8_9ASCO|nr:unnamed protein product [Candida verbasci]